MAWQACKSLSKAQYPVAGGISGGIYQLWPSAMAAAMRHLA